MIEVHAPDVIVITETFLDASFMDNEIISQDFCLFQCDRNLHGGGVLIAIRNNLSAVQLTQYEPPDAELLWVQVLLVHLL